MSSCTVNWTSPKVPRASGSLACGHGIVCTEHKLHLRSFSGNKRRRLVCRWNQLDVAIVLLSVMGIVLEEMKSGVIPINPTIIRVMRVLRIARGASCRCSGGRVCDCPSRNRVGKQLATHLLKAKFHYASWFEAGRRPVASRNLACHLACWQRTSTS